MTQVLEGVKVGPLDPDATERFGQVAAKASARRLIRLHTRMHPPELVAALSKKLDEERTKALDLDEVNGYLDGLEFENGDPVVPKGAVVEGAQVRGEKDRQQVLTFTYRVPSGRTAKWFAPYDSDALPESYELGSKLSQVRETRELGLVAWDSEGTQTEVLRREGARLRRQNDALRATVEARGDGELPEGVPGDTRRDEVIVGENERLGAENQELKSRLAALEAALEAVPGGAQALARASGGQPASTAGEDEPVAGYDDLNAADAIKLAREEQDREQLERLLEYERRHAGRKSVVAAAEQSLGRE